MIHLLNSFLINHPAQLWRIRHYQIKKIITEFRIEPVEVSTRKINGFNNACNLCVLLSVRNILEIIIHRDNSTFEILLFVLQLELQTRKLCERELLLAELVRSGGRSKQRRLYRDYSLTAERVKKRVL